MMAAPDPRFLRRRAHGRNRRADRDVYLVEQRPLRSRAADGPRSDLCFRLATRSRGAIRASRRGLPADDIDGLDFGHVGASASYRIGRCARVFEPAAGGSSSEKTIRLASSADEAGRQEADRIDGPRKEQDAGFKRKPSGSATSP